MAALTQKDKDYIRDANLRPDGSTTIQDAIDKAATADSTAAEIDDVADKSANGVVRTIKINLTAPADGNETDTAVDLPDPSIVLDVFLDVTTAEATGTTKTLDVGLLDSETGGDPNGFLDGVAVGSVGLVKGTLASGGQTLGALLSVDESGAGVLVREPHVIEGNAKSVSYTASAADWAEFVGDLYIVVMEPSS